MCRGISSFVKSAVPKNNEEIRTHLLATSTISSELRFHLNGEGTEGANSTVSPAAARLRHLPLAPV